MIKGKNQIIKIMPSINYLKCGGKVWQGLGFHYLFIFKKEQKRQACGLSETRKRMTKFTQLSFLQICYRIISLAFQQHELHTSGKYLTFYTYAKFLQVFLFYFNYHLQIGVQTLQSSIKQNNNNKKKVYIHRISIRSNLIGATCFLFFFFLFFLHT